MKHKPDNKDIETLKIELLMKIEFVKSEIEKDEQLSSNIDIECINVPKLHNKWFLILLEFKDFYSKVEKIYNNCYVYYLEYYLGKLNEDEYIKTPLDRKIQKTDVSYYLNSTEVLNDIKQVMSRCKHYMEFIESFIKNGIINRSFLLNTKMEYLKFTNGNM